MKVQMFRAVDSLDGRLSLFAIRGDRFRVCDYSNLSKFIDKNIFDFDEWDSQPLDHSRMINPELIWESEE